MSAQPTWHVMTAFGPSDPYPTAADAHAAGDPIGLPVVRRNEDGDEEDEMAATTTIETTSTDLLAPATTGLEPSTAASLRALFVPFLEQAQKWEASARAIKVTSVDDKRSMKLARESRLALREIRVKVEHARKTSKADALARGKAVDGIANAIKGVIEPIEAYLEEQETFAARAEAARKQQLAEARAAELRKLDADPSVYTDLGALSDEAWAGVIAAAKAAYDAKLEAARQAEAVRIEAERIAAEKREAERQAAIKAEAERVAREKALAEEAARLRAEAEAREKAAAEERARVEAERAAERAKAEAEAKAAAEKARVEREALEAKLAEERRQAQAQREAAEAAQRAEQARIDAERRTEADKAAKLQAELDAKNAAEAARLAAEADSKRPTKAKYAVLVAALESIAALETEKPAHLDDDFDDWTFGGNFDDARAAGCAEGEWFAAEEARKALAAVGLGK